MFDLRERVQLALQFRVLPVQRVEFPLLRLGGGDAVVELATQPLGEHGKRLKKGMIVSSGSMVACQFVPPGSTATGRKTAGSSSTAMISG